MGFSGQTHAKSRRSWAWRFALIGLFVVTAAELNAQPPVVPDAIAQAVRIPEKAELQKLIEETLAMFNRAIAANDFEDFYKFVSLRWRFRGKDPRVLGYSGTDPGKILESDPYN